MLQYIVSMRVLTKDTDILDDRDKRGLLSFA